MSIGELLAAHRNGLSFHDFGLSNPIRPEAAVSEAPAPRSSVHFQIFREPEPEPEPEVVIHRPPRKIPEFKPKPGEVKTMTPEQLQRANAILHSEGKVASDKFIAACHDNLVPVAEVVRERVVAVETVALNEEREEVLMHPMMGLVERAQAELAAVTKNIEQYLTQTQELKTLIEKATEKQLKLEDFVQKHNKLIEESVGLMELLPALPVAEVQRIQAVPKKKPEAIPQPVRARSQREYFGIREIREIVIPQFVKNGHKRFGVDDVMKALGKLPGKKLPEREKMAGTLYAGAKDPKATYVKTTVRGEFRVKA